MSRYTISSLLSFAFLAASHIFTADSITSSYAEDQLLLVAGNEPGNGSVRARVLLKSTLQEETTVIDLPDHQVSSACGLRYPSRCSNLTVESTRHNDQVSSHVAFIPLEDGIFILKVTHNGSALGDSNYISYEVLPPIKLGQDCFNPTTNCTSLGIFKIRSSLYSLCVSSSSEMCSCQIDVRDNSDYFVKNCQVYPFFRLSKDQISNVVVFQRQQSLFYFFVENYLFNINLDTGSHGQVFDYDNMDCLSVDRLILVDYTLYIYCTNVSAIYHLNNGTLTDSSERRKFVYPCSAADNVEVNLNETTTLTYSSQDGSKVTVGLAGSGNFVTGKCFIYRGSVAFLYLRETDGVYLFDRMKNETFLISNTSEFLMNQNRHVPLVFSNMYFAIQSGDVDSLSLYDIRNIQTPLLSLYPVPQRIVVAFVSDLNVTLPTPAVTSTIASAPTPTPSFTIHTNSPLPPSHSISPQTSTFPFSTTQVPPPAASDLRLLETIVIAVVLILVFIVIIASILSLALCIIIRIYRTRERYRSEERNSNDASLYTSRSTDLNETDSQNTSTNVSTAALIKADEHSTSEDCSQQNDPVRSEDEVKMQQRRLENFFNFPPSQIVVEATTNHESSQLVLETPFHLSSHPNRGGDNSTNHTSSNSDVDSSALTLSETPDNQSSYAQCVEASEHNGPKFIIGPQTSSSTSLAPHPDNVLEAHRQMEDKVNQPRYRELSDRDRPSGENGAPNNDHDINYSYHRQWSTTSEGSGATL